MLTELQDRTNFSTTELEVLLNHFMEHQTSDDHLDRATFLKCLGTGKCSDHLFSPPCDHRIGVEMCPDCTYSEAWFQGPMMAHWTLDST